MNRISNITITGLWASQGEPIHISFNEDVNFLIGPNGTGKTTIINLISAALEGDFVTLDRIDFDLIVINLAEVNGRRKPSIIIEKIQDLGLPFKQIEYRVRDAASAPWEEYSLDEIREQRLLRFPDGTYKKRFNKVRHQGLVSHLRSLVNLSWLSIHRASNASPWKEESYESTIDQKLGELNNRLVRYFSTLHKQGAQLIEGFQEKIFLSLLVQEDESKVFSLNRKLDLHQEKKILEEIFRRFELEPDSFQKRVDKHFGLVQKAQDQIENKQGVSAQGFAALASMSRIHKLVQDWINLLEEQAVVFRDRDNFLNILNPMLRKKNLVITESNELLASLDSGDVLPLQNLSSGEKQLLIILGEALLQHQEPWVYIADEPELSLHVAWQEALTRNIRSLNPNAQIVFATHSPDIVSSYGENVIDMREIVH